MKEHEFCSKKWWMSNFLFRGIVLMIEQILWYTYQTNLYIAFQVNFNGTEKKKKKIQLYEFENMFSHYEYACILRPPSSYVVLPSNKKILTVLNMNGGVVFIKMAKAFRGYFSSFNGEFYWMDKNKYVKQESDIEKLKKEALLNYNKMFK